MVSSSCVVTCGTWWIPFSGRSTTPVMHGCAGTTFLLSWQRWNCSISTHCVVLHFSDLQWHMPTHVYILMGSLAVLMGITNVQGHTNQHEHLHFHSVLMTHCAQFPGLHFTMVWSPPVWTQIMDTTAWFRALQACQITLRASLTCLQSAAYSKAITWEHTFSLWAKEWQAKWDKELWPSFAYKYALCGRSSNGSNHPLWNSAVHTTLDAEMGHFLPMFLHHTTSITLCLVVGHMFTSNYPWRFWPDIPWDQHTCTCGWPTHSFHHLLYECPHGHKYCQWSPFWWSSCNPEYFFTKELTPSSTTSNPHPSGPIPPWMSSTLPLIWGNTALGKW